MEGRLSTGPTLSSFYLFTFFFREIERERESDLLGTLVSASGFHDRTVDIRNLSELAFKTVYFSGGLVFIWCMFLFSGEKLLSLW